MVANIRQVIEATRNELVEWWDKCYFSQKQREAFKPFFAGKHKLPVISYFEHL